MNKSNYLCRVCDSSISNVFDFGNMPIANNLILKNDNVSKEEFKKRVKESKQKAIEENIAKAEKEGNKLMQSINENDDGEKYNFTSIDPGYFSIFDHYEKQMAEL